MSAAPGEKPVTELLAAIHAGEAQAWDRLLERVYQELHVIARRAMAGERPGHLLQTTALVHEAYLRLVRIQGPSFTDHGQFFRAAASAMRRILIDEARRRRARPTTEAGTASERLLEEGAPGDPWTDRFLADIEGLNTALSRFEMDPRHEQKARLIELRYFAGLTIEQTAAVLGTSPSTVKRDWEFSRAWLKRELERAAEPPSEQCH